MRNLNQPKRFRVKLEKSKHPTGVEYPYFYGCYFPMTDLCVTDMGRRGTGEPPNVEWLDEYNQEEKP